MRKLTCDPNVEVIGAAVLSIVHNIGSDEIQPFLGKYDLENIDPEQWYPAQSWLSVMNDIADEKANVMTNYVAVGMQIAQNVILPPDLESATLTQILNAWDDIYQMQHRGGDIGYVKIEQLNETSYRTIHEHIYPDDLTYGLAYGWCKRFLPKGTNFRVAYEDIHYRLDMGDGNTTVILIQWD